MFLADSDLKIELFGATETRRNIQKLGGGSLLSRKLLSEISYADHDDAG